jgi:hypothetical protein
MWRKEENIYVYMCVRTYKKKRKKEKKREKNKMGERSKARQVGYNEG